MQDSYERYREYQGNRCEYEMEQFTAPIVGILFTAIITKFWWVIIGGIVVLIMIRLWRKFFGGKAKKNVVNETIKNEKKPSMAKNILWIIAAIIISLIVGAFITFIKKKRQTNKFDNDYFDDDDSDADYSDNDSIVEYEESAEESDITESTSEIQSNSDDLEEYLDD